MAKLGVIAILIVLAATSCNKEQYWYGRKITFVAKSKGYMTKSQATKTAYAGEDETVDTKLRERIDWTKNDRIYVYCGSAINDGDDSHYAEYGVEKFSAESDAVSKATIQPTDFANSMEWGTGTHDFYAMYPSPKGHATNSFTAGTMVFNMPAAYPVAPKTAQVTKDAVNGIINFKPDMDYAPMLAAQTGVSAGAGSVTLPFTPQFDAFEITIGKATYSTINLSQFRIYGAAGDKLSGTFTVAPTNYAAVQSIAEGATNTVTLDLNGNDEDKTDDIILNGTYPTLKLTVLTLPGTFTNGITIEFTGEFDGAEQTRKLTLKTNTGDFVEFAPYKKYRIYGLTFPVLVGATIEDGISWDFGLEIMDSVIWWIGSAMESHITWTDDIDINAYTELPDEVKWFSGAFIEQDFSWEELDHIALNSDADMYLWRTETGQRTVTAYNRTGTIFSDVSASWSCTPRSGVIHLNETTGEVRAVAPGEATVTATVTPNDGSTPWTASYKVYVNAPTGITLTAAKDFVKPQGTTTLTATVTCTSNGTPAEYPADLLEWTSATTSKITVSGSAQPAIATGQATATATGVAEGTSTLTVSVAAKYADGVSALLTDFQCEDRTAIEIAPPGEKYKFRGIYMAPGFLQNDGGWGLTPAISTSDGGLGHAELDGLASVMSAYGTAEARGKYYFSWNALSSAFTTTAGVITGTVINDPPNAWRIPEESDWHTIIKAGLLSTTKVESQTLSKGFAYILVNLDKSYLDGQGLTTSEIGSAGTDIADGGDVSHTDYIGGMLLIPDGATIYCSRLNGTMDSATGWSTSTNCITYHDLEILVNGGCLFIPAAGKHDGSYWKNGGTEGIFWSATLYFGTLASSLEIQSIQVSDSYSFLSYGFVPVRLIHD